MASKTTASILALVADVLEMKVADLSPETHLFEDLGVSSLDLAEVVWRLEEDPRFGIGEIPDEDLQALATVGDIIAFIDRRMRQDADPVSIDGGATVMIAADHHGRALAEVLRIHLTNRGIKARALIPDPGVEIEYPDYAEAVANAVVRGEVEQGVLVGRVGLGMAIAANKVDGVRAVSSSAEFVARMSRQRYNANILCLGAGVLGEDAARSSLDAFLDTTFDPGADGRNLRCIHRIHDIEKQG